MSTIGIDHKWRYPEPHVTAVDYSELSVEKEWLTVLAGKLLSGPEKTGHAGWKTVFVWLWANLLYAYR